MKIIFIIIVCCYLTNIARAQITGKSSIENSGSLSPGYMVSPATPGDCTGTILLADSCIKTGASFQIHASFPILTVTWDFGEAANANDITNNVIAHHTYSTTGRFSVTAIVTLGCGISTFERTINMVDCDAPPPCAAVILPGDTCIQAGTAFTIATPNPVQDVLWNFNDPRSGVANTANGINSRHTFSAAGRYTVAAIVQMDCGADTLFKPIAISSCDTPVTSNCRLYAPNAFTPNGDNVNDYFRPFSTCTLAAGELFIYNRWGETVYSTKDVSAKWDGTSKGHKCPAGNYIYRLSYQVVGQPKKIAKGNILLLR